MKMYFGNYLSLLFSIKILINGTKVAEVSFIFLNEWVFSTAKNKNIGMHVVPMKHVFMIF